MEWNGTKPKGKEWNGMECEGRKAGTENVTLVLYLLLVANVPYQLSFHSFSLIPTQSTHLFKHYHVEADGCFAMISHFCVKPNKTKFSLSIRIHWVMIDQEPISSAPGLSV